MRHWTVPAAIGAAILSSSSAVAGPAQPVVSGIYERNAERGDNAFDAIDRATAGLPDATRPLARMRLRKSIAAGRIRISSAGNRLGIAYDAKAPIVVWLGEEPIKWKLTDVLVFDVSAKTSGDGVAVTFRGDDSERTTTYRSVGDDLVEDTTITSSLFSTPVVYTQIFERAK